MRERSKIDVILSFGLKLSLARLNNVEFTLQNPSSRNVDGASLGAAFDMQVGDWVSLYGGVEGAVLSDDSTAFSGCRRIEGIFWEGRSGEGKIQSVPRCAHVCER